MVKTFLMIVFLTLMYDNNGIEQNIRGGVAFLDQGNFLLSNAKWTVVFDIPTNQFMIHLESLKVTLRQLQNRLGDIKDNTYCKENFDLCMINTTRGESVRIWNMISSLEKEIYAYHWMSKSVDTRAKRGLIDIVGKGLKFLFGVADSEDVRKIDNNIGNVRNNLKKTLHYMEIQATYINHTIDAVIETRHAVARLESVMTLLNDKLKIAVNALYLMHAINIIELSFDGIWREWTNFRNAIHELGLGKLSPYLLGPEKFLSVLSEVRDNLPEEMKLLTSITKDTVHLAYGWVQAIPTLSNGELRVFLHIPLKTSQNHFTLYRILLVPQMIPNSSLAMMIEPESPYIARASDKRSHMLISTLDLLQCTDESTRFCDLPNMVKQESCAMSLLTGSQEEVLEMCPRKIIPQLKPIAYRLDDQGNWLYSMPQPTQLSIKCPDKGEDQRIMLQGQGVVQIPDSCTGYADKFMLSPHFQGRSVLTYEGPSGLAELDDLNLLEGLKLDKIQLSNEQSEQISKVIVTSHLTPEIKHLPIEHFQKLTSEWQEGGQHDIHMPFCLKLCLAMIGVIGSSLILACLYQWGKVFKECCSFLNALRRARRIWNKRGKIEGPETDETIEVRTASRGTQEHSTRGERREETSSFLSHYENPDAPETNHYLEPNEPVTYANVRPNQREEAAYANIHPKTVEVVTYATVHPNPKEVVTYANMHPTPRLKRKVERARTSQTLDVIPEGDELTELDEGDVHYDEPRTEGKRTQTNTTVF